MTTPIHRCSKPTDSCSSSLRGIIDRSLLLEKDIGRILIALDCALEARQCGAGRYSLPSERSWRARHFVTHWPCGTDKFRHWMIARVSRSQICQPPMATKNKYLALIERLVRQIVTTILPICWFDSMNR